MTLRLEKFNIVAQKGWQSGNEQIYHVYLPPMYFDSNGSNLIPNAQVISAGAYLTAGTISTPQETTPEGVPSGFCFLGSKRSGTSDAAVSLIFSGPHGLSSVVAHCWIMIEEA